MGSKQNADSQSVLTQSCRLWVYLTATYVAGTDVTLNITMKDWPIIPAPGMCFLEMLSPRHVRNSSKTAVDGGCPTGESQAIIAQAGPVFFFGCAMVNFLMVLNTIVGEKEYHLRHGMQMMGLKVRCAGMFAERGWVVGV